MLTMPKWTICALFGTLGILIFLTNAAHASKRFALVIGNSVYENAPNLKNPVNDANLMSRSLEDAGFTVTKIINADYKTLKRAMLDFGRRLRSAPDAGLFYYAGHGVQVRGENYLIPANARISDEDEVELEAININSFLRVMNSSSSAINIVVLDACRNNPFARSFRSVSRGLAPVDAPKGTYIAYATSPGDVASDGGGDNSPYSAALAKAIEIPGLTIEQVFKKARKSVLEATDAKQVPWETSSITGDFYFHTRTNTVLQKPVVLQKENPVDTGAEITLKQGKNATEIAYWNSIKNAEDSKYFQSYLTQYPQGQFLPLAKLKIAEFDDRNKDPTANQNLVVASLKENNETITAAEPLEDVATKDTIRSVQKELNRLGCSAGKVDGVWGRGSRRALGLYRTHSQNQLASLEPSSGVLISLKAEGARICPLNCGNGYKAKNNVCVRDEKQANIQKRTETKRTATASPTSIKRSVQKKWAAIYGSSDRSSVGWSNNQSTERKAISVAKASCLSRRKSRNSCNALRSVWTGKHCKSIKMNGRSRRVCNN